MSYLAHQQNTKIHEITFWENSRRACQYLLELIAQNFQEAPKSALYLLVDMRPSGILPLTYLQSQLALLQANYPQHAKAHLALVLDKPEFLRMAQMILCRTLRSESVRYFTDIEAAREWLASN